MAKHLRERTWADVYDEPARKLEKLVQFINECEECYQKTMAIWAVNDGTDRKVAKQLFGQSGDTAGLGRGQVAQKENVTNEEIEMVADLKAALAVAHTIATTADIAAIRKVIG